MIVVVLYKHTAGFCLGTATSLQVCVSADWICEITSITPANIFSARPFNWEYWILQQYDHCPLVSYCAAEFSPVYNSGRDDSIRDMKIERDRLPNITGND